MADLRRQLRDLPPGLRDGVWAQCTLGATASRLVVAETREARRQRLRAGLRRRLVRAVAGAGLLAWLPWLSTAGQVAAAMAASLLLLAALDGLYHDLPAGARPRRYALVDLAVGRLVLYQGGNALSIPLDRLRQFLVVHEPGRDVWHLGVVVEAELIYLPWTRTRSQPAAAALAWLLGYVTQRGATQLEAPVPPPPEAIATATPIEQPASPA